MLRSSYCSSKVLEIMKWLYLSLDFGTLFFPIVLSFEKQVRFFRLWKSAFVATLIISIPFLIWDYLFTEWGFWGFNPNYNSGISLFSLPLEEILFFTVVPFACIFIYEVCGYYLRSFELKIFNRLFYFLIPAYSLLLVSLGNIGYYTMAVVASSSLVLVWMMLNAQLRYVGMAFLISLLPFFLVNGVLTGSFIPEEVVWYSEAQIVSPRLFTIPMEDILYCFTLVVANILVFEKLKKRWA